jgi:uncharacterized protein (DUF1330 family)
MATSITADAQFAPDSSLEGNGFELPVPRCARIADSTVGDIHITDPASYQAHLPRALATIARFGGRVVAGGGKIDFLEGDPMPERIFIIEFSTAGAARRWNQSDDYQEALKTRLSGSHGRVFLIEGNEISGAVPVAGSRLFSFCP